jgi:hypothetical protein
VDESGTLLACEDGTIRSPVYRESPPLAVTLAGHGGRSTPPKEALMARVDPYHTKNLEEGEGHRNVYHNDDECPAGKRIKPENLESGRDDRPLCEDCE